MIKTVFTGIDRIRKIKTILGQFIYILFIPVNFLLIAAGYNVIKQVTFKANW